VRMVGRTPARLLVFLTMAVRKRPHIIGGFHIMFNGIAAIILARLVGSRSMYFCTGGPAEVRDGGIHSADSLFAPMETPDPVVQRRFLKILADVDVAITMGTGAVRYFRDQGIDADFHVIAGGIDGTRFRPAEEVPLYDLIMTGRLVPVKRIDVFLRAVRHVADRMPAVKAVVVGDGRLREALQALSVELGIGQNVRFAGHQEDVAAWLRRSKVFVLSSDSEGLSLSLMEAMMCGLPAVVSAVGDLADLVKDGVNGYLVPRRSPQVLADRLVELLSDTGKWEAFARAARHAALPYEAQATVRRWDHILAACRQGRESGVLSAKPMRG
jgi:glycosyltransferase involved in cell wall biosynthesis